jgi:hypothetical protein
MKQAIHRILLPVLQVTVAGLRFKLMHWPVVTKHTYCSPGSSHSYYTVIAKGKERVSLSENLHLLFAPLNGVLGGIQKF